jgi:hypothetical protein
MRLAVVRIGHWFEAHVLVSLSELVEVAGRLLSAISCTFRIRQLL